MKDESSRQRGGWGGPMVESSMDCLKFRKEPSAVGVGGVAGDQAGDQRGRVQVMEGPNNHKRESGHI